MAALLDAILDASPPPHRAGSRLYVAAAHATLRASMPSGAPIPLNLAATQQLQQSLRLVALQLHLLTTSGISGNQGSHTHTRANGECKFSPTQSGTIYRYPHTGRLETRECMYVRQSAQDIRSYPHRSAAPRGC